VGAATAPAGSTDLRWRDGLVPVLVGWVWARCCVAIGWVLSNRLDGVLENPRAVIGPDSGLFTWDGNFYRDLAVGWYDAVPEAGARFFPLYPALARGLAPLLGGREDVALVVLANAGAFAGAWVLWRLVAEVVDVPGPPAVATRAGWMVALVPSAFVMVWAYTEGLALLLVAATLLALHRRAFVWAGVFGLLSAALRPVGAALLLPILIELVRARPRPRPLPAIAALAGPVLGLVGAMLVIARTTGDLWVPVEAQRELRGGFQDPITRVLEPIGEIIGGNFRDVYNLAFMVALILLFVVAVRRRQPLSWLAYAGVTLVVTLSSQQTDSLGRYGLVVVPFVVALAQWAQRRWQQVGVAVLGSVGLAWWTSEALLGRLVP
jgi:hypothetical protein